MKEYSWNSKKSIDENAVNNNISYGAMSRWRRDRGLKCVSYKKRRERTLTRQRAIACLWKDGFNYSEIASLLKMHPSSVCGLRDKYYENPIPTKSI